MQRRNWLLVLFLVTTFTGYCQSDNNKIFNQQKQQLIRNGMLVLGSWGLANMAVGAIANANTTGSDRYFHQMNIIWGGINLGLSTLGYFGNRKKEMLNTGETLRQQGIVEKTFIFNAGLDVAYIAGGLYMTEKAKNQPLNHDRLKGYGNSIIIQGAALLLFDGIMYAVHSHHGKKLYQQTGLQLAVTGNGIGMVVKW